MSADNQQNQGGNSSQQLRIHPNSLANLRKFEPGDKWRGNPGGAKKGTPRFDLIYARLCALSPAEFAAFEPANVGEEIAIKQIREARSNPIDSIKYAEKIADRTDGPVAQRVEVEQSGQSEADRQLLAEALRCLRLLIEQRGLSESQARAVLGEKAPALAGYLPPIEAESVPMEGEE